MVTVHILLHIELSECLGVMTANLIQHINKKSVVSVFKCLKIYFKISYGLYDFDKTKQSLLLLY